MSNNILKRESHSKSAFPTREFTQSLTYQITLERKRTSDFFFLFFFSLWITPILNIFNFRFRFQNVFLFLAPDG